ncbi:MAG: NAD(P)/FAD-dependent oxidoreductase [Planctomycetota bacterium]
MNSPAPIVIVGGGLAGLAAANALKQRQTPFLLLEASDRWGGRLHTDRLDGFLIDRGFQVLQTAYPEAQKQLDYAAQKLRNFQPGALIRTKGRFVEMSDPWRRPSAALATLFTGVGTLGDRWRLAKLRSRLVRQPVDTILSRPDESTADFLLKTCGFSRDLVDRFFRPWFSGVFLENQLETSCRFFQFVFKMLAQGDAALPEEGMQAIPQQMVARLPAPSLRLNARVERLTENSVQLDSGEQLAAAGIVLATEGSTASRLLGKSGIENLPAATLRPTEFQSTVCYSFAAPKPPHAMRMLMLNGELSGPIAHMSIPSNVAPSYAPAGKSLVSVTAMVSSRDQVAALREPVQSQLRDWFGSQVEQWLLIAESYIPEALPRQLPGSYQPASADYQLAPRLVRCGDYLGTASINGALLAGRQAVEHLG